MYLVAFNKGRGTVHFGPFETAEAAAHFIEEDTEGHKPHMKVVDMVVDGKVVYMVPSARVRPVV